MASQHSLYRRFNIAGPLLRRRPLLPMVQLWSREAAVRGLISEELLPRLLLCSGPDYAIRDVIRGRPVKLRDSLSLPNAVDPRQLFPRLSSGSTGVQQYVHFTVSRAGMDLQGVLATLAGHSSDSLQWGLIHNPHRSSLCTQVVSLPLEEWIQHVLPRWSSTRAAITRSSTNRGGTFDIGDVAVQSFPIDASLSNGYRYELTLRPAVWHDPQLSDEFQTTPQAGVYDISKAFENGVFVPPPEPQKPPIRGYSGVKQTSYKEFPFVNYFDLHALDYPRCRDHLIGLAALTGNFRQAIGFLFARGYGNIDDASRAFDAFSRGDYVVCATLLPERFHAASQVLQSLSAGATWREAFLACEASERYISSGLRWIWNGVASRRVTLSRSVLPGDLIMPPDADTPFIVQNDEDARRYTLSQVVIPLNLLDKSLLPTSIGNFPSAIIATIHEAGDLTEIIPREKFRPLVSHARSVYIDPVDGGALRASFTLNSGSYADVAMREVCGDQILCKSEEGPRKVELNLLRMFPDICFL